MEKAWDAVLADAPSSDVQIMGGDFNAEPHEPAIRYLLGEQQALSETSSSVTIELPLDGEVGRNHIPPAVSSTSGAVSSPDFLDAWSAIHPVEDHHGFTFPVCNAVKRIDYVLYRRGEVRKWTPVVTAARLVGENPTDDSGKRSTFRLCAD